jgi:hypothetical protein
MSNLSLFRPVISALRHWTAMIARTFIDHSLHLHTHAFQSSHPPCNDLNKILSEFSRRFLRMYYIPDVITVLEYSLLPLDVSLHRCDNVHAFVSQPALAWNHGEGPIATGVACYRHVVHRDDIFCFR